MLFKVVSLPGSGTRFCIALLDKCGVLAGEGENQVSRQHVGVNNPDVQVDPAVRIVIPQRDPVEIFHTRQKRQDRNRDRAPSVEYPDKVLASMLIGYKQLERFERTHRTITIPVDVSPIDPKFWRELTNFLNVPSEAMANPNVLSFLHEWPRVGSRNWDLREDDWPQHPVPEELLTIRTEMGY